MEIIVARTSGFCFGVDKALKSALELIEKKVDGQIYTLGPIIHNDQVVGDLNKKGVKVLESIDEVDKPGYIIIRAHGIGPGIYEKLKEKDIKVTDATCPYVKKIHRLVKEKSDEGYQVVIVGDGKHPEVIGINGWCGNSAFIVDDPSEVENLPGSEKKLCVVAQTTITNEKWEIINKLLEKKYKDIIKFDTICNATSKRQNEASEIAKSVDMMLVVGGLKSSNTQKLYEVCKKYCKDTFKIETSGDLPPVDIKKIKKIGITAGASTPDWVIKEVIEKMSELNKHDGEVSFKEAFESSLVTLQTGDIVKGKIVGFNNAEVYVDLGFKSDGIIPMDEFTDDPDFKPDEVLKVGEEVEVFVVRVNDGEGNVLLSKKKIDSIRGWDKIEEAYENKTALKAKAKEVVNGGIIAITNGIKVFIPASQVSDRFVKDLSEFVNSTLNIRVIEYNKQKRKVVGSQRVLLAEEKASLASNFWEGIEAGKKYNGVVKSLTDFGAFVDIGGVDGLIHITELSWKKIKHPSEVLKVGDKVEVSILEFDKDKKKISLGYRKTEDNPWSKAAETYKVGEVVKGKVVRLVPFGAFVELEQGIDGLVHISQISSVRIGKPGDVLEVGQVVEAKVTEINTESKKIGLSIKEVNPIDPVKTKQEEEVTASEVPVKKEEVLPTEHKEDMGVSIGDLVNGATGKEAE